MSDCSHPDCNNKDSVHYFMCHMTQEEFEYATKDAKTRPFEFNMIRGKVEQRNPVEKRVTFTEKNS